MKVVIAEKPSVGKALAKVMGASSLREGYVEGNGYAFTWAYGHLIQLAMPEFYGHDQWNRANLPMLPDPFKLLMKQTRVDKKKFKDDPGVKKQLAVISNLFDKASEIIVATDAGREGELIFRYIYEYLGCRKSFKRLWISSQTDKAIRDGFNDLRPGTAYDSLYKAARARSEADWLVGLNATQSLTVSVGKGTYSIGRVQTPTLVMICDRYLENINFKPEIYFQVELELNKSGLSFVATSQAKWTTKADADERLTAVKKHSTASVSKIDVKEKTEPVPLLYDLTTLQKDANKKFGMTADATLAVAQKLYESKFITYPRTGSRYIGEDVFSSIPGLIKLLCSYSRFTDSAKALSLKSLNKRSVNADKVTDHHALLPTEIVPSNLTDEETKIYELISGRMIEAFGESCVKELTTVQFLATEIFVSRGTIIKYAGWRSVFGEPDDEGENVKLPILRNGESVPISSVKTVQKQTKPKPLHTEGTLLDAMETCGKEIEDEQAKEAMKDSGLGTPATRAAIIEKLFERDYIERKKKSLIPTEKGLSVYDLVKDKSIGKPVLTGEWEKKFSLIEKGELDANAFIKSIRAYTAEITDELLNAGSGVKSFQEKLVSESGMVCPKCKTGTISFIKNPKLDAAVCSAGREVCGFILFRVLKKKKLNDAQMVQLIKQGKTGVIKGFMSKDDKPFDARVKWGANFVTAFEFESVKR